MPPSSEEDDYESTDYKSHYKSMESFKLQKGDSGSGGLLGILVTIGCFALGRYMGLGFFVLLIPGLAGWWLGGLAVKKKSLIKLIDFVAWSNVITWFIPAAGVATSMFAFSANEASSTKKKKIIILGVIGLVASLINAVLGIAIYGKS